MRINFSLSIVLACIFSLMSQTVFAEISESERKALIALYGNTDSENWRDNTGSPKVAITECDWVGVACDTEQLVVKVLDFNINQSSKNLPVEISNLKMFQYLNPFCNQLSDSIPDEICGHTLIQNLYLNNSQLTGRISAKIDKLTQLHHLSIPYNQSNGSILVEMMNLPLLYLDLCGSSMDTDALTF